MLRLVSEIQVGDIVRTENGKRPIRRVFKAPPRSYGPGITKLAYVNGLGLTPSHPILVPAGFRDKPAVINPVIHMAVRVSFSRPSHFRSQRSVVNGSILGK